MSRLFLPEVIETTESIFIAWDNRRSPLDSRHLRTLLVLGPVLTFGGLLPVCITFRSTEDGDLLEKVIVFIFAGFWWFFVAVIGYDLLGRLWAEWVEMSATSITVGRRGFLAPASRVIPIRPGTELFFGVFEDDNDRSPRPSLEFVGKNSWSGRTRIEFGRWLTQPAREQVYLLLAAFVASRQIPIAVRQPPS